MREDGVTCGRITRCVGGCCEVREDNERCWSMVNGAGFLCEVLKDGVSCLRMVEGAVLVVLEGSGRYEMVRRGLWDGAGVNVTGVNRAEDVDQSSGELKGLERINVLNRL